MLIATLGVALTGCSCFDSKPVNPQIIGFGRLGYDSQEDFHFVATDSMFYVIDDLTIYENSLRGYSVVKSQPSLEGVQVTMFTCDARPGIQAIPFSPTVQEIEDLYHENYTILVIFACLVFAYMGFKIFNNK